jgi:hypothetical protein
MPEDIAPVEIPPSEIAPEETTTEEIEEVVEEEVEAQISEVCAAIFERIDMLEAKVSELHERSNGYATTEHEHSTGNPTTTEPERDEHPRSDHFYFKRLGE